MSSHFVFKKIIEIVGIYTKNIWYINNSFYTSVWFINHTFYSILSFYCCDWLILIKNCMLYF